MGLSGIEKAGNSMSTSAILRPLTTTPDACKFSSVARSIGITM